MGLRQVLEGGALADLVEQALCLLGGGHQDLQRVRLLGRVELGAVGLEVGARLGRGRPLSSRLLRDPFLGEEAIASLVGQAVRGLSVVGEALREGLPARAGGFRQRIHRPLHLRVAHRHAREPGAADEQGAIDQPVEQRAPEARHVLGVDLGRCFEAVDDGGSGAPAQPIDLALHRGDRNRRPVGDGSDGRRCLRRRLVPVARREGAKEERKEGRAQETNEGGEPGIARPAA